MQAKRKNMERMAEVVPDSDEQALQHFLSNVDWDTQAVISQVAQEANELLGEAAEQALLIDESGFSKKGVNSVGVSRQWNGRLGKVDNCQVGVFASLCRGRHSTLIDSRLYLPKAWTDDKHRCHNAHIPPEHRGFKTKPQLALEMVAHAREIGLDYGWVGADGLYGNDPAFLLGLDAMDELFMVDVHKNQRVYLTDPAPKVPEPTKRSGRKPSKLRSEEKPLTVERWTKQQSEESWKRITLREGEKGALAVEVLHTRVWYWDGQTAQVKQWQLFVRREVKAPKEIKYSLSNADASMNVERLAHMQSQRYWIERVFQNAKSHCGLGDYQVRGWQGWNHHVALVMIAMLFMLKERLWNEEDIPLLSCADIEILLSKFLPRRDVTGDEIIAQMETRHRKRQAAIDSQKRGQLHAAEEAG